MNQISQKAWIAIITVVTVVLIVLQYLSLDEHHGHWWDMIPGFWAIFGFVGCWLITMVSKKLGKLFIQTEKRDDYAD